MRIPLPALLVGAAALAGCSGLPVARVALPAELRAVREGRLGFGGRDLEVRSLHEAEGTALPLVAPIG